MQKCVDKQKYIKNCPRDGILMHEGESDESNKLLITAYCLDGDQSNIYQHEWYNVHQSHIFCGKKDGQEIEFETPCYTYDLLKRLDIDPHHFNNETSHPKLKDKHGYVSAPDGICLLRQKFELFGWNYEYKQEF